MVGGTNENQVQANDFLQFAQEQCLQLYIEEPTRKNNILHVFFTNNDQLTRQIIITETSMSDHNIIQIETNKKIVEEKQKYQTIKCNLSYRDCSSTDVKTDEMYKIIINICLEICKKTCAKEKPN